MEPDRWTPLRPDAAPIVTWAYEQMVRSGSLEAFGTLLDLAGNTNGPQPYLICKGRKVRVLNPKAREHERYRDLFEQETVAGFPLSLWDAPKKRTELLPAHVRMTSVIGYFYQVHHESVVALAELEAFLADSTGRAAFPSQNPQCRVVILCRTSSALSNTRRFARRKRPEAAAPVPPATTEAVAWRRDVRACLNETRQPEAAAPPATTRCHLRMGKVCDICKTEDGQFTGCNLAHVICKSCLRGGLRAMVGDAFTVDKLLCGCYGRSTRRVLLALAERADTSLQDSIATPPTDRFELQDFKSELQMTRRQFNLGTQEIPSNLYATKLQDWFNKSRMMDEGHLYHACKHPACADRMENWIKVEDFERDYRAKGTCVWRCKLGHQNSVLPSDAEIEQMNKTLLLHPEYYVQSATYSGCALRRYRLCPECLNGGMLMLANHGGECKQWPGYGRGHRHVFCFACTRQWGTGCDHGKPGCADPGVQQVRKVGDKLEIGYVDSQEYIQWLNGQRGLPPPTKFPSGPVAGDCWQRQLNMPHRTELLQEMQQGTT